MPPARTAITSVPRLNLGQILRLTPDEVRIRGVRTCTTSIKNVAMELDALGASKVVQATSLCVRETHRPTIRIFNEPGRLPESLDDLRQLQGTIPTGNNLWQKPVWVGCDCEWFLYTCEVALARYGCTNVIHSNGVYPIHRNPRMIPMMCKHLVALAPIAIKASRELRPDQISDLTYPTRGRRPRILQDLLRKKKLTPTDREVGEALNLVKDFL